MTRFYIAAVFSCLIFSSSVFSQDRSPGRNSNGILYGKIVEEKSRKGVEAVSVQLFLQRKPYADSLIRGMLTLPNGEFRFEGLPTDASFRLEMSAIGFQLVERNVGPIGKSGALDIGNVRLPQEASQLEGVTVVGTRPTMKMGIDRKVFNVEKNLVAAGGTAVDVMRNIPSVTVDVEGNIELRNSSPQVFVDGRPTILSLDQIPAENIDRIELITNPSAKFDAASGGGIINVILKKNKRLGLNGNVSAGIGSPEILNGGANLNLREGKFNFFVGGNYNTSGGVARSETHRENRKGGVTENYFNQFSRNERARRFASLRYGVDFFLDNRNSFSVSQEITSGTFSRNEEQQQQYLDELMVQQRHGIRFTESRNRFNKNNVQLNYKHSFNTSGKELTADITRAAGDDNNQARIRNTFYNNDGSLYEPETNVRNGGGGENEQWTFQADYVNPRSENSKIEAGLRTFINHSSSHFGTWALGSGGTETKLPLGNNYSFREVINAAYFTYSGKLSKFGYQAGLRGEYSDFTGNLIDSARSFGYSYPKKLENLWDALFPSLFITYNVSDEEQLQANYSRRIRRPNFRQVNPFIDINDPVNLQRGNPELRPEFVNSMELNYNRQLASGNLLASVYYRNNNGDITQYSDTISSALYQELNNAAIDPNAILNTYINANSVNRLGIELTWQQKLFRYLEFVPSFNLQYRTVDAEVNDMNLSNEGSNWQAKLTSNYKFPSSATPVVRNLGIQLTAEYESPQIIPQGKRKEQYGIDFAIRKEMLKGNKGSVTFAIDDVFNSKRFGTIYDTENFYQDGYRRFRVRSYKLTLSYRFGDTNFSIFNRKKMPDTGNDFEG